jgi:putative transcriptional regulator
MADEESSLRGQLLVANPLLPDPNFDRTVVLVLSHSRDGALGVVLNRPSELPVGEPLPQWEPLATAPSVVFVGGPVSPESAICLGCTASGRVPEPEYAGDESSGICDGVTTIDLERDPMDMEGNLVGLRVFAGYAGWGASQLEGELSAGAWWVVSALVSDVIDANPDDLWKRVLRRQGGELALAAAFPADPSLN